MFLYHTSAVDGLLVTCGGVARLHVRCACEWKTVGLACVRSAENGVHNIELVLYKEYPMYIVSQGMFQEAQGTIAKRLQ